MGEPAGERHRGHMHGRHLRRQYASIWSRRSIPLITASIKLTDFSGPSPLTEFTSCNRRPSKKSKSAVPIARIIANMPIAWSGMIRLDLAGASLDRNFETRPVRVYSGLVCRDRPRFGRRRLIRLRLGCRFALRLLTRFHSWPPSFPLPRSRAPSGSPTVARTNIVRAQSLTAAPSIATQGHRPASARHVGMTSPRAIPSPPRRAPPGPPVTAPRHRRGERLLAIQPRPGVEIDGGHSIGGEARAFLDGVGVFTGAKAATLVTDKTDRSPFRRFCQFLG